MTFDIPHMIVTGVIIFGVIWLVDHSSALESASKGRKTLLKFGGIFAILIVLNILWPYGSTA